jgi:hypothetical protein
VMSSGWPGAHATAARERIIGFSSLSHHHEPWLLLGDAVRGMTFVKGFSFDLNRKAVASREGGFLLAFCFR